jgi:signal transduction histidine kinase
MSGHFLADGISLSGGDRGVVVVVAVIALAALGVGYVLLKEVLAAGQGTTKMQEIAKAVQEGAAAYLKRQRNTLGIFGIVVFALLFALPADGAAERIGRSLFFLVGAGFSFSIGYLGMWLSTQANLRVAAAAREEGGREAAMRVAFRTGGVVGMTTVGLGLFGASLVVLTYAADAPKVLEGFGFGAALIAMFMRVGGGIFTKAADVGADLVGKVEQNIPEDDPRNAATIADNVGDNVGDCAGMAADIFESYEVTIVAAMILGYASFGHKGVIFPLLVRAIGVIGSIISTYSVSTGDTGDVKVAMRAVNRGFWLGSLISIGGFMLLGLFYLQFDREYVVSQAIERGVLNQSAALTALYVDSVLADHLQDLATRSHLAPADLATFDHLLTETPLGQRIVVFKVWSTDGEVLYSPDRRLMGQRFEVDDRLEHALRGEISAEVSDLTEPENRYERERWPRLVEIYAPVRDRTADGRILAGVELYQPPEELEAELMSARLESWGVVATTTLVMSLVLAGLAKQGSDTIARQQSTLLRQAGTLRRQVRELSAVLAHNAMLHQRLRQAAARTTTLHEQALRRISADLHAGPGQALALALLRLDALNAVDGEHNPDVATVRRAVQDALSDMRAISTGLRLPILAPLGVAEVVERAVRTHERRAGTPVELHLGDLPGDAPLPVKITLFRALQEALSNATRHAGGSGVVVRVQREADGLSLSVADQGPGFAPEAVPGDGHLGLANLHERAELLGGHLQVSSAPGKGTTVRLWLPLSAEAPESV